MKTKKLVYHYFITENQISKFRDLKFRDRKDSFGLSDIPSLAQHDNNCSIDMVCLLEFTSAAQETEHEKNLNMMKAYIREAEIPVYAGGYIRKFEDVKKYLYTGAEKVIFAVSEETKENAVKEAAERFGKEKLIFYYQSDSFKENYKTIVSQYSSAVYVENSNPEIIQEVSNLFHLPILADLNFLEYHDKGKEAEKELAASILSQEMVFGITSGFCGDISKWKQELIYQGISIETLQPAFSWQDFKLNSDGLIPVVVQDYKTEQVLMLAYMNETAYLETISSGKMTYYSRSRQELWKKGLTSGHFQYVKELRLDCDKDTILAKVSQIGAACHTGNITCFFQEIARKEYKSQSISQVLDHVYQTILDRKVNPKEGSYTNYLFEKGIDKILKKVGEEATEIVIAAKNPEPEEIKYEISDFLYHVMVLMAEKGVTWEDITKELSNR